MQWKTPMPPPGATSGATYNYMALTSDGTKLIAVDSTNAMVSFFSPDNPGSGQSISLRNPNVPNGPPASLYPPLQASYVAITNTGKVWITTSWHPAEIDLSNMNLVFRTDSGLGLGCGYFRMSPDSSQFVSGCGGTSDSGVAVWDSTTDTFHGQGYMQFFNDFAISNDGQKIAALSLDQLAPDDVTYFIDPQLHFVNSLAYPDMALPRSPASFGIQFSPQGSVYLLPRQDCIDFMDVATGKLRARYVTPELIVTPQNVVNITSGALAVDSSGKTIFVISASGITVIESPSTIDSLPQPVWPFSLPERESVAARTMQKRPDLLRSHGTFTQP